MPDVTVPVTLLEVTDRNVRISSSGMEIVTTFYVEPASAAPIVVCALLGRVDSTVSPPTRTLPGIDFEYPFCYCVEARQRPVDRRAVSSCPPILGGNYDDETTLDDLTDAVQNAQAIFDGPSSLAADGSYTSKLTRAMCGAFVDAVYRPLPTVYTEDGNTNFADWQNPQNCFDYLDPQFYPASRSFPANGYPGTQNGFCLMGSISRLPVLAPNSNNTSLLVTETWQEITIRRVMCPSIPWTTISQLENRINGTNPWTPAHMTIPGLPNNTFPTGTLRFDNAAPVKRSMPTCLDSNGQLIMAPPGNNASPATALMTWWDITYTFSWRTTYDLWWKYGGVSGTSLQGPEYIPWNCDWYIGADTGWGNWVALLPGWYEMVFEQPTNPLISFNIRRKYLDAEDPALPLEIAGLPDGAKHPFDMLFMLGSK